MSMHRGIGIPILKQRAKIVAVKATMPAIDISMFPEISKSMTAKPSTPSSMYDCDKDKIFSRLK